MAAATLSDFSGFLSPEQSAPIFNEVARMSVVQRLAQQVPLGASGKAVPVITGRPTAGWTAEGTKKHVTEATLGLSPMQPHKLTAMIPLSMEVVRANPGGIMDAIRPLIAEAFSKAFDAAALHGDGPFTAALADTTKIATMTADPYADIVGALDDLVQDGKKLTGFVFDDIAEPLFLAARDNENRPLLAASAAENMYGSIIGRPVAMEEGVKKDILDVSEEVTGAVIGFAGNWRKAAWGVVGGINYRVSDEAVITIGEELVSAFENNLVIVRAEAEYGFVVEDAEHFIQFQTAVAEAGA